MAEDETLDPKYVPKIVDFFKLDIEKQKFGTCCKLVLELINQHKSSWTDNELKEFFDKEISKMNAQKPLNAWFENQQAVEAVKNPKNKKIQHKSVKDLKVSTCQEILTAVKEKFVIGMCISTEKKQKKTVRNKETEEQMPGHALALVRITYNNRAINCYYDPNLEIVSEVADEQDLFKKIKASALLVWKSEEIDDFYWASFTK